MILRLPFPPSLNNLFHNVSGRGRAPTSQYMRWKKRAASALWGQTLEYLKGPVSISVIAHDQGRADLDNLMKPLLDFLVTLNLIEDDRRAIVRKIEIEWGDAEGGVIITILPLQPLAIRT